MLNHCREESILLVLPRTKRSFLESFASSEESVISSSRSLFADPGVSKQKSLWEEISTEEILQEIPTMCFMCP